MGVYGLWRLLDSTGKPVPLETLEGKVLAIDVSIWIHQVLQGYQDRHGQAKPNAHLLGLYHRICKLLYYKIKPVFVFDGGVPMLKRSTIASRRKQKSIAASKAQKMKTDLINNLIKHTAVKTALNKENANGESSSSQSLKNIMNKKSTQDMFKLPEIPHATSEYTSDDGENSDSSVELSPRKQTKWMGNIHSVDVCSNEFKSLPADVRYDILTDLKETRKQNSWGRLHEMPKESNDFSSYQMKRLLKRRFVQESLESAEKEMGGKTLTLDELEKLLADQGVKTGGRDDVFRIASDSTTRLIYISDKNALTKEAENGTKQNEEMEKMKESKNELEPVAGCSSQESILDNINEYDFDDDWCSEVEIQSSSSSTPLVDNIEEYEFDSDWESNNESNLTDVTNETEKNLNESQPLAKKYFGKNSMNPALTYMLEYSGLTQNEVIRLIEIKKENDAASSSNKTKTTRKIKSNNIESNSSTKTQNRGIETKEKATVNVDNSVPSMLKSKIGTSTPPTMQKSTEVFKASQSSDNKSDSIIIECNSDSDDFVEIPDNTGKIVKKLNTDNSVDLISNSKNVLQEIKLGNSANIKVNNTIDSDSNTDSDDFIEIKDVPIPEMLKPPTDNSKTGIEITIKSDMKPDEDDFFADIFSKNENDSNTTKFDKLMEIVKVEKNADVSISDSNHNDNKRSLYVIPEQEGKETDENVIVGDSEQESLQVTENKENVQSLGDKQSIIEENIEQHPKETDADSGINIEASVSTTPTRTETTNEIDNGGHGRIKEKLPVLPITEDELLSLKGQLETEQKMISENLGKMERQATDITDQIRIEAQELLRLFGLPYIVAPMEAEAQCAFLEQINLTDGTITDDSDIWLFGGKCVYKNFFNHNKRVLQFQSCDIEHHFKLTRNEMIQLALLVGSDYTTGLPGIGPVTALEILAAFPCQDDNLLRGLTNFCRWIKAGRIAAPGKTALRNKLRNVQIEKGFPSQAVVQAYLFPTVDESKETFTWGKPNIVLLADYVRTKFGWTKLKFEEIMGPVMKRIEEHKNQKMIDAYFKLQTIPKSIETCLSKRVAKAVQKLNNADENDFEETSNKEVAARKAKSKPKSAKSSSKKHADLEQQPSTENKNACTKNVSSAVDSTMSTVALDNNTLVDSTDSSNKVNPIIANILGGDKNPSPPKIPKLVDEFIPQREKDKANALKKKLHAIEVFRKSKQGLSKTKRVKRSVRKIVKEAALSEDSSSSS